jgi:hypothetical protein
MVHHTPVSLHDDVAFPTLSRAASAHETHIAYPASRTTRGPSGVSRRPPASRMSVDSGYPAHPASPRGAPTMHDYAVHHSHSQSHSHSLAGDEEGPPLPVPPRERVGTGATRMTRGTHATGTRDIHGVPTVARTTAGRSRRHSDSGSGSGSRSPERQHDRALGSTRSRAGVERAATMRAAPGSVPHADDYGGAGTRGRDFDTEGLVRRMKNLYTLEHPDFGFSRCTGKKKAVCVRATVLGLGNGNVD